MNKNDFMFHISCYRQVDLALQNIGNIRNNFKTLGQCPILVTSTSPDEVGFSDFPSEHEGVYVRLFNHAPGNPGVPWKSRQTHPEWRLEYLPPRIFIPIMEALSIAYMTGTKFVLHLHSDSFWMPDAEQLLIDECEMLEKENLLFRGDLSHLTDHVGAIPPGTHFQPEFLLFNVAECHKYGYGFKFREIWDDKSGFESHNYCAIEALFGQFAAWKLTGNSITKPDDVIPDIYKEKVSVRCERGFHGFFKHGYNLPGIQ